ncbi:hypothetical protein BDV12DRAFT_16137 [Aspergillus spectabilis]
MSPQIDAPFNVELFKTAESFVSHVHEAIVSASSFRELVYEHAPLKDLAFKISSLFGYPGMLRLLFPLLSRSHCNSVTESLWVRILPTDTHDCHTGSLSGGWPRG